MSHPLFQASPLNMQIVNYMCICMCTHTHTEKWFCLCVCPYPLSRMKEPCEKSLVVISGKCGSPVFSQ